MNVILYTFITANDLQLLINIKENAFNLTCVSPETIDVLGPIKISGKESIWFL